MAQSFIDIIGKVALKSAPGLLSVLGTPLAPIGIGLVREFLDYGDDTTEEQVAQGFNSLDAERKAKCLAHTENAINAHRDISLASIKAQGKIDLALAQSPSTFKSGGRPAIQWVYAYGAFVLFTCGGLAFGNGMITGKWDAMSEYGDLVSDFSIAFASLSAVIMLYVKMRTNEKVAGVANDSAIAKATEKATGLLSSVANIIGGSNGKGKK